MRTHRSFPSIRQVVVMALIACAGCVESETKEGILTLPIEPYEVPSGAEMLRCQEMTLPSDTDVDIVRFTSTFSAGNHHAHVYVAADSRSSAEARTYDCFEAVSFDDWHLLVAAQASGIDWTLPEGVAIRVKAHERLLIQTHYLSTASPDSPPMIAEGAFMFGLAEEGSVERRAGVAVGQNRDISVPPYSAGRVEGECDLPGSGEVFAMMGHHHTHGLRFQSWLKPEGGDADIVYESANTPEPPWKVYDELRFGDGTRFGWSCDYQNNMSVPLQFGSLENTQEHCNLVLFYALDGRDAGLLQCDIKPD